MPFTLAQLQAQLDAINAQIGDPTYRARSSDGHDVTYRTIDELRKAKAEIEEDMRELSGGSGTRVRLAQHRRGDGPTGPTLIDWW
jgi:hypothetical protein